MSLLDETCAAIAAVDPTNAAAAQRRLDEKTKPRRSLGRLEDLACRMAAIRRTPAPDLPVKAIVVMGADHGVAEEGVSAYPQEVTRQMLLNFARGGAAINVLARQAEARLLVVDVGVREPLPPLSNVRVQRLGPGTSNMARGPAMRREQARAALECGIVIARELVGDGITLVGIGDMGIGNTTVASALTALFTGAPVEAVTGRGTGVDDAGLARKIDVIRRAFAANDPDAGAPLDALAKMGGFEIAGLAGVVLGCAASQVPVMLDGFITGAAALAAVQLVPQAAGYLIASHQSAEAGHRFVLEALGLQPLLDLALRLGEGTGAALAMPLVDAALHILHDMATFAAAGVSDSGA